MCSFAQARLATVVAVAAARVRRCCGGFHRATTVAYATVAYATTVATFAAAAGTGVIGISTASAASSGAFAIATAAVISSVVGKGRGRSGYAAPVG